jgi:zinc transport system permease protein
MNFNLMTFWQDLVEYQFWRNAVIGGLIISLVCSYLSVYVVLRRMAFIGQGISHSALGGFALGILVFGGGAAAALYVDAVALIFCLIVALFIALTSTHAKISEDSAIGIFFVASMALGALFLKLAPGYNADVYSYLFGSVLAISTPQVIAIAVLGILVIIPLMLLHKELFYFTFDEDMAKVSGVPVMLLHLLLLALMSITIIISSRIIGVLLVSAFLILPGATAQLLTSRFRHMIIVALSIGLLTTAAGLLISNGTDLPTGSIIVLTQFGFFISVFIFRKTRGDRLRRG